jgi:hypothetical protein
MALLANLLIIRTFKVVRMVIFKSIYTLSTSNQRINIFVNISAKKRVLKTGLLLGKMIKLAGQNIKANMAVNQGSGYPKCKATPE